MSFRSNAIAMLTGTVMAQALPLLASPLLTRLYAPEAFGLQTLFMGLATSLAVLATCRMDLAVVLPKSDEDALPVAGFVLFSALLVSTLTLTVLPAVGAIAGRSVPDAWFWLLPLMVFLIAMYQLSIGFATRAREFRSIARANVGNQASYVTTALASGVADGWALGLVAAKTLGQVLGGLLLWRVVRSKVLAALRGWSARDARTVASRYRQFLLFNTPYSLVGSVARDAPVYLFSSLAAMGAAGFFSLARTVLMAPTLLAANAFSQVFFREAVALKGSPRLETLTLTLLRVGLVALAPIFAFFAVWGDTVFVLVFGESWRTAGAFAMVLAPAAWMAVQTGWPERLFEINMRQGVSFTVQLGCDALTGVAFAATYLLTNDPVMAVGVFAFCNVAYHHIYLFAIFRVSAFAVSGLAHVVCAGWIMFALCYVALAALRLQTGSAGAVGWIMALTLSCGATAIAGWFSVRRGLLTEGEG